MTTASNAYPGMDLNAGLDSYGLDRRRVVRLHALRLAVALAENTVDGVIADAKKIEAYVNEGMYGKVKPKPAAPTPHAS